MKRFMKFLIDCRRPLFSRGASLRLSTPQEDHQAIVGHLGGMGSPVRNKQTSVTTTGKIECHDHGWNSIHDNLDVPSEFLASQQHIELYLFAVELMGRFRPPRPRWLPSCIRLWSSFIVRGTYVYIYILRIVQATRNNSNTQRKHVPEVLARVKMK